MPLPMIKDEIPLEGLRLFVVEDEAVVAMMLENLLDSLGCVVVDIVGSVAQALDRVEAMASEADVAILDVNLGRDRVYPVADALSARQVPFLFATGYDRSGIDERYPGQVVLAKPYTRAMLLKALLEVRPAW